VRGSLTAELNDKTPANVAPAEPPSIWRDPLGVFKRAIAPIAPPEPKVDRYLTIQGLSALTRGYAPGAAPPVDAKPVTAMDKAKAVVAGPHATIAYWDPNRVRISVKRPGQPAKVTVFTFRRDKLFTWKLVHVRLPADER
jgi:hypothetical protein